MATMDDIEACPIQNVTFQNPGYLPVCSLIECAGTIIDPGRLHRITGQNKPLELTERRIFVLARNAALGHIASSNSAGNPLSPEAIPPHIAAAASACAVSIQKGECSKYYSANGAVRIHRGKSSLPAGQQG